MVTRKLFVVLGVCLLIAGCGPKNAGPGLGSGAGPDEMSLQELFAQLGQRMLEEDSARFEFTSVSTFAEHPTGAEMPQPKGIGLFDFKGKKGSMKIDLDGEGSGSFDFPEVEHLYVGDFIYMKIPEEARGKLGGKKWVKAPRDVVTGSPDPNGLGLLFEGIDAGKVTKEAEEEVRGDKTSRYRFEIPIAAFIDTIPKDMQEQARGALEPTGVTTVPGKIWIDTEGRPRRYMIDIVSEKFNSSVSYELYDFGVDVGITAPADPECHIVTTRQEYQSALGSFFTVTGG